MGEVILDSSTVLFESNQRDDSSSPCMRLNGSSGSSASVASRLYHGRSGGASGHYRRGSVGSSETDNELISFSDNEQHNDINYLSTQVSSLTKKLTDMEDSRVSSLDERNRLKMDNAILNERVHVLEEQVQATEQRYEERLEEERSRHKDIIMRIEREKTLEIESAALKYQVLEKDLHHLRNEEDKTKGQMEKMEKEVDKLRDELTESELLREELEEERIKLDKEFKRYKEVAQQDMDSSSELVEELSRQTHELSRNHPRHGSVAEELSFVEEELSRVKEEYRELKMTNDELQAQLLHASLDHGRSLLQNGTGTSLADELSGKGTSELLDALREQEVCNHKLRSYINGILMRVIELHPEILEIPACDGEQNPS